MERSIRTLEPLGSGYKIIQINSRIFIQSVPRELSQDQTILLNKAADRSGSINYEAFISSKSANWSKERFEKTVETLLTEGLIWVDNKTKSGEANYWIASFFVL